MRLKKSKNASDEEIIQLLNEGYEILSWLRSDYNEKKNNQSFESEVHHKIYENKVNAWGSKVIYVLKSIFPTDLESHQFLNPPRELGAIAAESPDDYKAGSLRLRMDALLKGLDVIRVTGLSRYTDLPLTKRLYIEDIDSFSKVRDVNPAMISHLLQDGYFDLSEEKIQTGLEKIISEPFHKKDWGGEKNDLYTSNITVNGARKATAMLLKGNGLKRKTLELANCGKNGDQLIRLHESPADLFIVQFVGNVSETVIKDIEGKIDQLRIQGKDAYYCIINGQDTARLLFAYGIIE